MSSDAKDALVDKIMDMSDLELIDTVREGLVGKYTLAISPEDAEILDNQVRIALRILCFDMIGQGKYLITKHHRDDLNAEAGREILVSVFEDGEKSNE